MNGGKVAPKLGENGIFPTYLSVEGRDDMCM